MTDRATYFVDTSHLLFAGITGAGEAEGGKTATCNWLQHELVRRGHFDFSVCFSPKGGNFDAVTVRSPDEAAGAVAEGHSRLEWTVDGSPASFDSDTVADAHVEAMSFADGLNGDVVAVHDDAQMYPDSSALAWAASMAGNPGSGEAVKSLVVCQNPWALPETNVRTNMGAMVWVGPVNDNAERYFKVMQMGGQLDTVKRRHTEPFMFSVVTESEVHTYAPVPEEYAE